MKQYNVKQGAQEFLKNMTLDANQLKKGMDGIGLGDLGLKDLNEGVLDIAKDIGVDGYVKQAEDQFMDRMKKGHVIDEGQKIWEHMQQKAREQNIVAAMKGGLTEAMAASQNADMRNALEPIKA